MDLRELTLGYLRAEGYDVSIRGSDLLIGTRRGVGSDLHYIYVWVAPDTRDFRSKEPVYLSRFKEAAELQPQAQRFMLVPTFEGLSAEFRKGANQWHAVKVRVPAQFFDTPFSWEESPTITTAAAELRRRGDDAARRRARQPFRVDRSGHRADDLMEELVSAASPGGTRSLSRTISVVIGPAGIGKSHLFEALFSRMYAAFHDAKRQQRLAPRPFPLLPDYIRSSEAPTVRALLRAFLQSDLTRALDSRVFEWMMGNGLAIWLLDGLDEIIAQDSGFFDYFLDLLTTPGATSNPRIILFVRDSLLSASNELRDFCEENGDFVEIYELEPWQDASKREFARIALGGRADEFNRLLRSRENLDRLATIPYYASLLTAQFEAGNLQDSYDEKALIHEALARIIEREYSKELLDRNLISEADVTDFLEALAYEDLEAGFAGIPVDEARSLAEVILPNELDEAERSRAAAALAQLALFSRGALGQLRFTQEILEQYLLGRGIVRLLNAEQHDILARRLAVRPIPPDWVTLKVAAAEVRAAGQARRLLPLLLQASDRPVAFRNILQLLIYAADEKELLQSVSLEHRDLTGVHFVGLNLGSVSFRGSNLTDVEFVNCELGRASFEECILRNTAFLQMRDGSMAGVQLGDLAQFYSIRVSRGGTLTDRSQVQKWFERQIGTPVAIVAPCPAALQLRHLFNKFVYPNGDVRRSWVDEKAVLRGTKYVDPAELRDACLRHGYLVVHDESRKSIARPTGNEYADLVGYATGLRLTPGIRLLLDEVCEHPRCAHVPPPIAP